MKIEYQHQIAELQLCIPPETPPEVREQRQQDIKASAAKIADNVASIAKLMEDSREAWENLQDHPDVGKIQETIKLCQDELDAVRVEIKMLPPMQKMAKVKRSKELQQKIESCRMKELVEKEKAADDILHNLTSRFQTLVQKILPPDPSQSVPRRDTSES